MRTPDSLAFYVPVADHPQERAIALQNVRLTGFLLAALGILVSAHTQALATIAPKATSFELDNGLQVVVIPDHRAPVVTHMIWYKAGSVEDPPGKSGIAHFLEHLMFKGTANYPPGEFQERVAEVGGRDNAFTSHDVTAYHQTVPSEHLGLVMEYEADRMTNLIIDDDAIATEREVIKEERRTRVDNEPGSQLGEALSATLFQNSRYGIPVIGWAHEMVTLDRDDALAFYDRYYHPSNAVLVVAGDVEEAEVRELAEATYGQIPRRSEPRPRIRQSEPEPLAAREVTLADPRVTLPTVRRAYLVPSYVTDEPGEAEALSVLNEILGSGTTSRIYRSLVVEQAIASAAGSAYRGTRIDDTTFGIFAAPRDGATLEDLASALDEVIAELIQGGITGDELIRAKRRIVARTIYAQDSSAALARAFGQALATGGSIDSVRQWPDDISAVTAEDVMAAARKYLDVERSVTGYLIGESEENRT